LLHRAEDVLRADVHDARVVAGEDERRVPVEAEFLVLLYGLRADEAALAGAHIASADGPALAFGINEVRVGGIDAAHEAVAAADEQPVLVHRAAAAQHVRRAA